MSGGSAESNANAAPVQVGHPAMDRLGLRSSQRPPRGGRWSRLIFPHGTAQVPKRRRRRLTVRSSAEIRGQRGARRVVILDSISLVRTKRVVAMERWDDT